MIQSFKNKISDSIRNPNSDLKLHHPNTDRMIIHFADALESETEKKRWEALQAIEDMIIKKYRINQDDFKIIETVILKTEPHKAGKQWKFTGAFYYGTARYFLIIKTSSWIFLITYSSDRTYDNRLRPFNSINRGRKIIYNVLRNGRDSLRWCFISTFCVAPLVQPEFFIALSLCRTCDVPKYRWKSQQTE